MKKIKSTSPDLATDEAAEQVLWDCLAEIPFIQIQKVEQRLISNPGRPEIMARLKTGESEKVILAEVKSNGQSRLVREAIDDILKYRETYANAYGLVIAPLITAQAARICRQEGIGYLDFSGNCLLNFDFVFVSKIGKAAPVLEKKAFRSWYSPRAERVLRVLFMHSKRLWKIRELAMEAHVTPNQALNVKEHLLKQEWLENCDQAFRLTKPDLLLDDWAEYYGMDRSQERRFSSPRSTVEIEVALAATCEKQIIPYSLMGFSAAMRFDPTMRHDRVSAYVLSDISKVISALELSEVSSGKSNVSLWIPYDEGVLRGAQQFDHAKITTPIQTYLDLINLDGRGEKAAHYIWQHFIKEKWCAWPVAA